MGWAFRGRWLVGWFLVAIVGIGFVRLGVWQLDRLQWRRELNATIEQRRDQPSVELGSLVGQDADALEYRVARATGSYDTSREAILYGRARNGQAGNHLLTPLLTDDGSVLWVDRGWVPLSMKEPGVLDAQTPDGAVVVEGVLLPPASADARPPSDTVKDVNLTQLAGRVDGEAWPVYLLLREQDPPQGGPLPEPVPEPALSEGNHLSYAIQWFIFATIAVVGWALLLRREGRDRRSGPGRDEGAPGDAPSSPPLSRAGGETG